MNQTALRALLSTRLLLPGLVFVCIYITTSHTFYQENLYKLFLLVIGVSILWIWQVRQSIAGQISASPERIWLILSLPLIATIPGYLLHGGRLNYHLDYELILDLAVILWAGYIYASAKDEDDTSILFLLAGATIVYITLWAFLEKSGYPFLGLSDPFPNRAQSTFGHPNLMAAFLIMLLPVFLASSFPSRKSAVADTESVRLNFSRTNIFSIVIFFVGIVGLVLTQTRSAMFASALSLVFTGFLASTFLMGKKWHRNILKIALVILLIFITIFLAPFFLTDIDTKSRFLNLYSAEGWYSRYIPWQAALASIKDSPFFGYGLGSSYNLFFEYVSPDVRLYGERSFHHAHSEILELMEEGGLVGLTVYIGFWAYIFSCLIKVIKSDSLKKQTILLAIGILGGFLAYHIHSVFSLAYRMATVKLVLYTLLATAMVLHRLSNGKKPEEAKGATLKKFPYIASFLILLILCTASMPFLKARYDFAGIATSFPSLLPILPDKKINPDPDAYSKELISKILEHRRETERLIVSLENLVKKNPDVYALDYLSKFQINHKRISQLNTTVQILDGLFPKYRETGHTKAALAYMEGDYDRAKNLALEYQKTDIYFQQNIRLLINLAILTDDPALYSEQIPLLVKILAYKHNLVKNKLADEIKVKIETIASEWEFKANDGNLSIKLSQDLITGFYERAIANKQKRPNAKTRNSLKLFLQNAISNTPYFRLNIWEGASKEKFNSISDAVLELNQADKSWDVEKRELANSFAFQLKQATGIKRSFLKMKQQKALNRARMLHEEKRGRYESFLAENSDWGNFKKKSDFAGDLVGNLINLVFIRLPS